MWAWSGMGGGHHPERGGWAITQMATGPVRKVIQPRAELIEGGEKRGSFILVVEVGFVLFQCVGRHLDGPKPSFSPSAGYQVPPDHVSYGFFGGVRT